MYHISVSVLKVLREIDMKISQNYSVPNNTRERVLGYVLECLRTGVPPTYREIQRAFGFQSVNTAREHVYRLLEDGKLVRHRMVARGLRAPEGTTDLDRAINIITRIVKTKACKASITEAKSFLSDVKKRKSI